MNNSMQTTGLVPLIIGSVDSFTHQVILNGLPDSLVGGTAVCSLRDPTGNKIDIPAVVTSGAAVAPWTVVGPTGGWTRWWTFTDANGVHQVSLPIPFQVSQN